MPMYLLETSDYPGEEGKILIVEADSPEAAAKFLGGSVEREEYEGCYNLIILPENMPRGIPTAESPKWTCSASRNCYRLYELPLITVK